MRPLTRPPGIRRHAPRLPRNNAPRVSGIALSRCVSRRRDLSRSICGEWPPRRPALPCGSGRRPVTFVLTKCPRGEASARQNFSLAGTRPGSRKLRAVTGNDPLRAGSVRSPFARGTLHRLPIAPRRAGESGSKTARQVRGASPGPLLCVSAGAPFVPRRVRDFLVKEARRDIEAAVASHAKKLGVAPRKITLRDTTSRWGSCSAVGARLSFFLAPDHGALFRPRLSRGP